MVNFKVLSSFLGCPKEDDLDRAKFPGCFTEDVCFFCLKPYFYKWRYFSVGDRLIWFLRMIQHHHVVIKSRNNWWPWINTDLYIYVYQRYHREVWKELLINWTFFSNFFGVLLLQDFSTTWAFSSYGPNRLDSWWCPSQTLLHPVYVGKFIVYSIIRIHYCTIVIKLPASSKWSFDPATGGHLTHLTPEQVT